MKPMNPVPSTKPATRIENDLADAGRAQFPKMSFDLWIDTRPTLADSRPWSDLRSAISLTDQTVQEMDG